MLNKISPGSVLTAGIAAGYLLLVGTATGQEVGYPDPVAAPPYVLGDPVPSQPAVSTGATAQASSTKVSMANQNAPVDCGCATAAPAPEAVPCDSGCATAACGCGKKKCGGCLCRKREEKPAAKPNPCAKSHNVLFYANDFSYLGKDDYCGHCLGDRLKLKDVGRCLSLIHI